MKSSIIITSIITVILSFCIVWFFNGSQYIQNFGHDISRGYMSIYDFAVIWRVLVFVFAFLVFTFWSNLLAPGSEKFKRNSIVVLYITTFFVMLIYYIASIGSITYLSKHFVINFILFVPLSNVAMLLLSRAWIRNNYHTFIIVTIATGFVILAGSWIIVTENYIYDIKMAISRRYDGYLPIYYTTKEECSKLLLTPQPSLRSACEKLNKK